MLEDLERRGQQQRIVVQPFVTVAEALAQLIAMGIPECSPRDHSSLPRTPANIRDVAFILELHESLRRMQPKTDWIGVAGATGAGLGVAFLVYMWLDSEKGRLW